MLFNSFIYLCVFLPITALVYFVLGARLQHRLAIAWLVAASLFYYGWWNPAFVWLIVGSALFNFLAGLLINSSPVGGRTRLLIFAIGVAINIAVLGYYKYANFLIDNVNWLFGSNFSIATIILPLALSFYTFQQISYLVDAYRGETKDYNFLHYLLFVTFFPQLIAGPILHHSEMMPQFDRDETYKPKWRNLEVGLTILVIGLFKKVVLADSIAAYARPVFMAAEAGDPLGFADAWLGATAFALQLYFDFSGYSDMAIGSARIFGIKLPINFYSPFKALNIQDLWRRWHMTLTRFITAYIYTPISINMARYAYAKEWGFHRQFWLSVAYPTLVTFLIAGIWHGAGWNFVIFGLLQGFYLVVNNLWREFRKRVLHHKLSKSTLLGSLASRFITVAAFVLSLVFFRATTTDGAFHLVAAMLGMNEWTFDPANGWLLRTLGLEVILFVMIFMLPNTQQFMLDSEPSLEPIRKEEAHLIERVRWRSSPLFALFIGGMLALAILQMNKASEFIYYQF